jgi:hypothetical protein
LKNVVVLPAVGAQNQAGLFGIGISHRSLYLLGDRSLASCLAGGDLDGYAACVTKDRQRVFTNLLLATLTTSTLGIQP